MARKRTSESTRQKISRALKGRGRWGGASKKKNPTVSVVNYLVKGRGSGKTRLASAGRGAARQASLDGIYGAGHGALQGTKLGDSPLPEGMSKVKARVLASGAGAIAGATKGVREGAILGFVGGAALHKKPKVTTKKNRR